MRQTNRYDWWETDRPLIRTRVPRQRRVNWGPLLGILLTVVTGIAFWAVVIHAVVKP